MCFCKEKTASKHVEDKDVKGMVKYGVSPTELEKKDEEKKDEK